MKFAANSFALTEVSADGTQTLKHILGEQKFMACVIGAFFEGLGLSIFANVPLFPDLPKEAILPFLYICLINSAAGYVCHMLSLEMTSASETNLVYFLKPMLSPIIAFLFLKEVITANMWLGIALFLVGSAVAILPGILALRKTQ